MSMRSLAYRHTLLRSIEFLQRFRKRVPLLADKDNLKIIEAQLQLCQAVFLTADELTAAFDSNRPQDVEKKLTDLMRQTRELRSQFSTDLMTGRESKPGDQMELQLGLVEG